MMARPEDFLGQIEQVNLPGSTAEYPNWRRKASLTVEALAEEPFVQSLARAIAADRVSPSAVLPGR